MTSVLIADDDVELCSLLGDYLHGEGFDVETVHDGNAAIDKARRGTYDILVLDVMMPERNGFDVLRELRTHSQLPILMLTARGEEVDRIVGLEIGADDYLVKPCNPRELAARIRAVLRRGQGIAVPNEDQARTARSSPNDVIEIHGVQIRPGQRQVERGGELVPLTSTEFSVLEVLMQQAGQVVSKELLTERALGRKLGPYDRSIDMHVSNLRKKLGPGSDGEQRIKTVRSVGYLFVC